MVTPSDLEQAGFGAVHPLRSSRFLLMQVQVGYGLHVKVVVYALHPARQCKLSTDGLRDFAAFCVKIDPMVVTGSNERPVGQCAPGPWLSY